MSRHALISLALLLSVSHAVPAAACFDGYVAAYGHVQVSGPDFEWSRERAVELATWLPRLNALAGDEAVEVSFGEAYLADGQSIEFPADRFDILFDRLADALGTENSARDAAMALGADALTVQIAATRDRDAAYRMAATLGQGTPDDFEYGVDVHGFYEAGGFPAENSAVHVLERTNEDGEIVYQLVVGSFTTRSAATDALETLRRTYQLEGFVRSL